MSHKNKRYVLYVAGGWLYRPHSYIFDRKVSWLRYTVTRSELVGRIARFCRNDIVKLTSNIDSITADQLES